MTNDGKLGEALLALLDPFDAMPSEFFGLFVLDVMLRLHLKLAPRENKLLHVRGNVSDETVRSLSKQFSARTRAFEKNISRAPGDRRKTMDEFVFLWCQLEGAISHPFVRWRIKVAAETNDTAFFKAFAKALNSPLAPLDNLELVLLYGWDIPLFEGAHALREMTDRALFEFLKIFLNNQNLSFPALQKRRLRLKLPKSRGSIVRVKFTPRKGWQFEKK